MVTEPLRVSVVIPCFNARSYLAEAIHSAFQQSVAPFEIIVVDDGSTDGSGDVARSFGASLRLQTQENQGISAARNAGARLVNGDFLAFLDADDRWPTDSLAVRLEPFHADPSLDIVYGSVEQFVSPELDDRLKTSLAPASPILPGRLAGSMLVRTAAFRSTGDYDKSLRLGETMDWVARAEDSGLRAAAVPDIVLQRRIHSANTVTRLKAHQGEYLRALHASLQRRRNGATRAHD